MVDENIGINQEKTTAFKEELEKYLKIQKPKKNYSLYLTKDDVEFLKKKVKVPLSNVVDSMIKMMVVSIKEIEKEEQHKKEQQAQQQQEAKKGEKNDQNNN